MNEKTLSKINKINSLSMLLVIISMAGLLLSQSMQIRDLQEITIMNKGYLEGVNPNWESLAATNKKPIEKSTMEHIGTAVSVGTLLFAGLLTISGLVIDFLNKKKIENKAFEDKVKETVIEKTYVLSKQEKVSEDNNDFYAGLTPEQAWAKYEEHKKILDSKEDNKIN